jgi:hypothetical protein
VNGTVLSTLIGRNARYQMCMCKLFTIITRRDCNHVGGGLGRNNDVSHTFRIPSLLVQCSHRFHWIQKLYYSHLSLRSHGIVAASAQFSSLFIFPIYITLHHCTVLRALDLVLLTSSSARLSRCPHFRVGAYTTRDQSSSSLHTIQNMPNTTLERRAKTKTRALSLLPFERCKPLPPSKSG